MAHTADSVPLLQSHAVDPRWSQEAFYPGHGAFQSVSYHQPPLSSRHDSLLPQTIPSGSNFNGYRQDNAYSQHRLSYPNGYADVFNATSQQIHQHHQLQQNSQAQAQQQRQQRESSSTLTPPSTSSSPVNEAKTSNGQQRQASHPTDESILTSEPNNKHIEAMLWMRNNWKQHHQAPENLLQYTKEALFGLRDRQDSRYWQHQQPNMWEVKAPTPSSSIEEQEAAKRSSYEYQQGSYQQSYYDSGCVTNYKADTTNSPGPTSVAAAYHSAAMAAAAVVAQAAASGKSPPQLQQQQQHPSTFLSPPSADPLRVAVGGLAAGGRLSKGKKLSITGKRKICYHSGSRTTKIFLQRLHDLKIIKPSMF